VVHQGMETGPDSVTGKATEAAVAVEEKVASVETRVELPESTGPSFGVDEADSVVEAVASLALPLVPLLPSRLLRLFFHWNLNLFGSSVELKNHVLLRFYHENTHLTGLQF